MSSKQPIAENQKTLAGAKKKNRARSRVPLQMIHSPLALRDLKRIEGNAQNKKLIQTK